MYCSYVVLRQYRATRRSADSLIWWHARDKNTTRCRVDNSYNADADNLEC